jgi:hypothetical protein
MVGRGQKTMYKTTVKETEKLTHFTLVSLLKQNDNQIYHQLHLSQTPQTPVGFLWDKKRHYLPTQH